MKTRLLLCLLFLPILLIAQFKSGENVTISTPKNDDIYLAGEDININATIYGDVVAAGGYISVTDSIKQDLILAGGDITVTGHVADDIRAAGGRLTIDTEVNDDVIVAGGQLFVTQDAIIQGNLVIYGGKTKMNGLVKGNLKVYAGELEINGKVYGSSKIIADELEIGDDAQFHKNVEYWTKEGKVNFDKALVNATAVFDENLIDGQNELPWQVFGIAAIGFWIFYLLSALLMIIILNYAFKDFLKEAVTHFEKIMPKSLLYGIAYIFGFPLLIFFTFIIVIGIPIGLLGLVFYFFSLLFAHLVVALLLTYYFKQKNDKPWNFWEVVFIAWGIAIALRLLAFIPFLGSLISFAIVAMAYGLVAYTLVQRRNKKKLKVINE